MNSIKMKYFSHNVLFQSKQNTLQENYKNKTETKTPKNTNRTQERKHTFTLKCI